MSYRSLRANFACPSDVHHVSPVPSHPFKARVFFLPASNFSESNFPRKVLRSSFPPPFPSASSRRPRRQSLGILFYLDTWLALLFFFSAFFRSHSLLLTASFQKKNSLSRRGSSDFLFPAATVSLLLTFFPRAATSFHELTTLMHNLRRDLLDRFILRFQRFSFALLVRIAFLRVAFGVERGVRKG